MRRVALALMATVAWSSTALAQETPKPAPRAPAPAMAPSGGDGTMAPPTMAPPTMAPPTMESPSMAAEGAASSDTTGAAPAAATAGTAIAPVPALTRDVDAILEAAWKDVNVQPSPDAPAGELLRRLTLDLAGRVPTIEETLAFEHEASETRFAKAVERLLASRESAEHLARDLTVALLGREGNIEGLDRGLFTRWLADELEKDTPFDALAAQILGARTDDYRKAPAAAYLLLYGASPPDIAGKTARFFLGNRIQCAQCHDHPYESWKRTDFWQLAAYFQRVKRQEVRAPQTEEQKRRKLPAPVVTYILDENPTGDTYIPLQPGEEGRPALALPRFLGGTYDLALHGPNERRLPALANAVTKERRGQFLRAMANRLFAELFGRGVVNPVDDFSEQHAPLLPPLLERITRGFDEGGARWKGYVRALALTRAYARSSSPRDAAAYAAETVETSSAPRDARDPASWKAKAPAQDPALDYFARARHKPLTPEQAVAAFATAARADEAAKAAGPAAEKQWHDYRGGVHRRFVELMARNDEEDPHSIQESIPSALVLMNGPDMTYFCQAKKGSTVELAAAEKDVAARTDRLYLAAFSRHATAREQELARAYFATQKDATKATEDLFWSLLNSSEFLYNH